MIKFLIAILCLFALITTGQPVIAQEDDRTYRQRVRDQQKFLKEWEKGREDRLKAHLEAIEENNEQAGKAGKENLRYQTEFQEQNEERGKENRKAQRKNFEEEVEDSDELIERQVEHLFESRDQLQDELRYYSDEALRRKYGEDFPVDALRQRF